MKSVRIIFLDNPDIVQSLLPHYFPVEIADLEKIKYTYIYRVNNNFSFMHPKTFEEIQVSKEDIDDWQFLVDGEEMEVKLVFFNGKVIGRVLL